MDIATIANILNTLKGAEHTVNLKVEEIPGGSHRISISSHEDFPAGKFGPGALSFSLSVSYSVHLTGIAEVAVEGFQELGLGNLPQPASTT